MKVAMTQQETLKHLAEEHVIKPAMFEQAQALLLADDTDHSPWYIHALAGLGAWISSLLFMFFAALTGIVKGDISFVVSGTLLLTSALMLNRINAPVQSTYASQLLLVVSLSGHILLSIGISMLTDSMAVVSLVVMGLSIVFILFYLQALHQFLSILMFFIAILVLAAESHALTLLMPVIITVLAGSAVWFWLKESHYAAKKQAAFYHNLKYAVVVGLVICASLLARQVRYGFGSTIDMSALTYSLTAIGLFFAMVYLIAHILQRLCVNWKSVLGVTLLLVTAFLSALFYQTPAIMISLIVLVLGIERGNRILIPFATVGFIYFLGVYYYNLDVTLLHKSLLLMVSGLVLSIVGIVFYKNNQGE